MTKQEAIDRIVDMVGIVQEQFTYEIFEEFDNAGVMATDALEKQIPQEVKNQQGYPTWGYCPFCGEVITKSSSPVGCKECLQRVKWEGENEE